jgi:PAS domain S-box-containing protein/putative nucleotidyltransferase with HDIG domain
MMMSSETEESTTTEKKIQILHLEDDAIDAELIQATLDIGGISSQITRVQTASEFSGALSERQYELILADYRLPTYDGTSALRFSRENYPDIPFIFVSGTLGEDAAIEGLTQGATDYVLKNKLTRLVPAVKRALNEAENRKKRKEAEEALRKTNVLLERIFSTTEFMLAYLDADYNFIRVNHAFAEVSERKSPEFFEGRNYFELYPNPENEAIFHRVVDTGEPYVTYAKTFVYARHPERGTTYWNWSLQPVKDENGSVNGLVLSLIDVTEREQAYITLRQHEEQLRLQGAALEAAANAFVITDRDGNIIWVNPAFTRLTGYSMEQVVGRKPSILKSGKQDPNFYNELWNTILSGEVWHGELINRHKDGHDYTEEMTIAPLRAERGEISHFIAVKQDVTERKHHELERESIVTVSQALRKANTRIEILTVILDQLVELFESDGALIALPDPVNGGVQVEMGCGVVGERFTGVNIPPGKGISGWVIANKRPYLSNRADVDSLFYRPELLGNSHCVASAPLIAKEQAIGALWIARKAAVTEQDLRLLNAIADIAANAIYRVTLHEQTVQQLNHLLALHHIDLAISTNFDLNVTINVLLRYVKEELEADAASVLIMDPVTHALDYAAGIGFRTRGIESSHVKLGSGCAGRAAQENRTISCLGTGQTHGVVARSSLLADEEFISHYVAPLVVKGQVKGILETFHRKVFNAKREWISYFETLATQAAIAIESASLFENLQRSNMELMLAYDATIEGWSRALDLRDKETEGHTQRVTEMVLKLAEKMGLSDSEKLDVKRGALLHDIGKMGVPDSILLKPGPLSESERDIMKQHPVYAYQMLSPIPYLKHALDIPYSHHEKWDGSGYPRGLMGENIPLSARMFAVVDVFDALTSDRPYRAAWPRQKVNRYIQKQAGRHFDPRIVEIFLELKKH